MAIREIYDVAYSLKTWYNDQQPEQWYSRDFIGLPTLTLDPSSYSVTGVLANLAHGYVINCQPGRGGPDGVDFDGTNDWLNRTGDFTSDSNSSQGIFSCWIHNRTNGGTIFRDTGGRVVIQKSSSKIQFILRNSAGTITFNFETNTTFGATSDYIHILAAWDTNAAAGAKIAQMYINDTSNVSITADAGAAFTIGYTGQTSYAVGADNGLNKTNSEMAEFYLAHGQYLDLSVTANRRKFISAAGTAVSLGPTGALPTGTAPTIFLSLATGDTANNFANNKGTGGNFTVTGALTTAAVPPPFDTYITNGADMSFSYGRQLNALPDSYTVSGIAATLSHGYNMSGDPGSYSVSGVSNTMLRGLVITALAGSYAVTGFDATLAHAFNFTADPGSYSVSGVAAILSRGLILNADPTTYSYTGADAGLAHGYMLNAASSSYTYTGILAALTHEYMLNAAAGIYTVVGADMFAFIARMMNAGPGVYSLTGIAADLTYLPVGNTYVLSADPGVYVYTGADATLVYTPVVVSGEIDTGKFFGIGITRKFKIDPKPLFNTKQS